MAQADTNHRQRAEDIGRLYTRNARGEMVPIGSIVTVVPGYGPDPVMRYNGYPAADLIGDCDPKILSSAQVVTKLTENAHKVLPRGFGLEWAGMSYQKGTQTHS